MNRNLFLSLLAAMLLLPCFGFARKIVLGGEIGPTYFVFQRIVKTDTAGTASYSSPMGYRGGFVAWLTLGGHYHFQSGLSLVNYALKLNSGWRNTDIDFLYLQVPLNVMFTTHRDRGFMAGSGFYFNYAVGGTYKHTTTAGNTSREPIPYGKKGHFKRADFGITTFILGWKFRNGLYVRAMHGIGVLNQDARPGNKLSGDEYQFTIGYTFKKKEKER